ncbi:MAG: (d)CMP kinase [Elusimicrobia bacterium]|nr:(d)CMP kinase [Elusimicrobiota bacterium]
MRTTARTANARPAFRRRRRRKGLVIAIDGPAGVGKSTVGRLVARTMGYHFINTGEMFRALAWKALADGVDVDDQAAVTALALRLRWEFRPSADGTLKTFIDSQAAAERIRDERVSAASSAVAANPGVRRFMCLLQRRLGAGGSIVMEGRDIGTHVFPDADHKIYLDAAVDERARRRYRQLKFSGVRVRLQAVREAMLKRDLNDLKRKINPLSLAPDAVVVDSTRLTLREVAGKIVGLIRAGLRRGNGSR